MPLFSRCHCGAPLLLIAEQLDGRCSDCQRWGCNATSNCLTADDDPTDDEAHDAEVDAALDRRMED